MPHRHVTFAGLATGVALGAMVAVQSRINGALGVAVGDGVFAAFVSFVIGWVLLTAIVLSRARNRAALASVPTLVRGGELPWWALLGGLGGATLVASQGITVPLLGVAVFTVAVVAGQTSSSLEVDRIGLGPGPRRPLTAGRVTAAALSIVAVLVAADPFGVSVVPWAVLLCIVAGALVSCQQAVNGRVSLAAGTPVIAGWVNFTLGALVLGSVCLARGTTAARWPSVTSEGWIYLGGIFGMTFVVTAAFLVPRLGVLLLSLTTIAGQLAGALVVDLVAPVEGRTTSLLTVAGAALTFVAVAVGARGSRVARP